MEVRFFNFRFVANKPASARYPWIFAELGRAVGKTAYRLFLSSAFHGWGLRLENCGDGSTPAPGWCSWTITAPENWGGNIGIS